MITLKTTTSKDNDSEESDKEEEEEDDLALMARKFKRFMKRKKQNFKRKLFKGESSKDREQEKDKKLFICFECKKPSHFKMDCFLLKKLSKKVKKKAMMV